MQISVYPTILTDKDWQTNKGKIAKMAGETGIGALMKKSEAAHQKVEWTRKYDLAARLRINLDRFDLTMSKDEIVTELEKESLKEFIVDAAPVRKLLVDLRDRAKEVAAEWKKKTLIPASSRKHVEEVAKAAGVLYDAMKEGSGQLEELFEVKKVRESLEKKKQDALRALDQQIAMCENGLKAALKNPTKKGWADDGAHQGCRSVNNGVAAVPALKKLFYPTWNKFGDNYQNDIPDNDPEEATKIKAKIKTVAKELIKYKAAVHKLLNG